MKSLIAKNGHDARYYLTCNARLSAVLDPLIEQIIVVEQLCDNEVCSVVDLLFQVHDVINSTLCLQMNLWVSSNSNAEIVSVLFSDEFHQVTRIVEAVLYRDPVSGTSWWVASQSKQVSDAQLLGLLTEKHKSTMRMYLVKRLKDLVSSHVCAGDVH